MEKKTIFLLVVFIIVSLAIIISSAYIIIKWKQPVNYGYWESSQDDFSVVYNDDKDEYDVFLVKANRHIFIPRSHTQIIISDNTEVVIEGYEFKNGRWEFNMYFYIHMHMDFKQ